MKRTLFASPATLTLFGLIISKLMNLWRTTMLRVQTVPFQTHLKTRNTHTKQSAQFLDVHPKSGATSLMTIDL